MRSAFVGAAVCGPTGVNAALIQRCQGFGILDHLPERQRPWVQAIFTAAVKPDHY